MDLDNVIKLTIGIIGGGIILLRDCTSCIVSTKAAPINNTN